MKITILQGYDGDWISVYRDGNKVWDNHSCPLQEGLKALGIEFEEREIFPKEPDFWTGTEFPETLNGDAPAHLA